jgi:phosphodiesterase/alkaline phosphatase D-like protein
MMFLQMRIGVRCAKQGLEHTTRVDSAQLVPDETIWQDVRAADARSSAATFAASAPLSVLKTPSRPIMRSRFGFSMCGRWIVWSALSAMTWNASERAIAAISYLGGLHHRYERRAA